MKTLVFVRHGKSSWDYEVSDKDRPLKERGIEDAHLVANEFKSLNMIINQVYSSPANRALHTCMIVLRILALNLSKAVITEALYDFSGDSALQFIKQQNNDLETIMVFGHNYAFTNLVNALGDKYIDNVPTTGLTIIKFDVNEWSQIKKGTITQTIFPKSLK